MNSNVPVADQGQIQLDLFGRINGGGWHWAGEADVFEGIAAVKKRFKIDDRRVMLRGFVAPDFMHLYGDFQRDMAGWLKAGKVKYQETVREGITNAPAALIGLLGGENSGKMLVKLAE